MLYHTIGIDLIINNISVMFQFANASKTYRICCSVCIVIVPKVKIPTNDEFEISNTGPVVQSKVRNKLDLEKHKIPSDTPFTYDTRDTPNSQEPIHIDYDDAFVEISNNPIKKDGTDIHDQQRRIMSPINEGIERSPKNNSIPTEINNKFNLSRAPQSVSKWEEILKTDIELQHNPNSTTLLSVMKDDLDDMKCANSLTPNYSLSTNNPNSHYRNNTTDSRLALSIHKSKSATINTDNLNMLPMNGERSDTYGIIKNSNINTNKIKPKTISQPKPPRNNTRNSNNKSNESNHDKWNDIKKVVINIKMSLQQTMSLQESISIQDTFNMNAHIKRKTLNKLDEQLRKIGILVEVPDETN